MDKLRRIGSKLLLRKDKDSSKRISEPVFQDIPEERQWQMYDCVYERPEKRYVPEKFPYVHMLSCY